MCVCVRTGAEACRSALHLATHKGQSSGWRVWRVGMLPLLFAGCVFLLQRMDKVVSSSSSLSSVVSATAATRSCRLRHCQRNNDHLNEWPSGREHIAVKFRPGGSSRSPPASAFQQRLKFGPRVRLRSGELWKYKNAILGM